MELKVATLYHRTNRFDAAEDAYQRGIRAAVAAGDPGQELRHRLYQGLAALYLQRGNDPAAISALMQSARVSPPAGAPFRLRLDVAQRLLQRGHARAVGDYAAAVLRITPDDEAAKALRDRARAAALRSGK
jgi:tetratricopeptide (TPR) repeat protein